MFKFKKLTAIALVAVAAMGLLAGCGNDKPKMTQQEGVLRVGSETTFPPFEFTEGDKYVGFDVDLSEAIAKIRFKNGIQIHGLRCFDSSSSIWRYRHDRSRHQCYA